MAYENAHGRNLFDVIDGNLFEWAEEIPWDFPGDDDMGHACGREKLEEFIGPSLRKLLFQLNADGNALIATHIERAFNRLFEQASAMDDWCEGNRSTPDYHHWPSQMAADAVDDPDWRVLGACYDHIRDAKAAICAVEPPAATVPDSPGERYLDHEQLRRVESLDRTMADAKRNGDRERYAAAREAIDQFGTNTNARVVIIGNDNAPWGTLTINEAGPVDGDICTGRTDGKPDTKKKILRSERVKKAINFINGYRKRVAKSGGTQPPLNAIISEHLDKPIEHKSVENLARQVRDHKDKLLPVAGHSPDE